MLHMSDQYWDIANFLLPRQTIEIEAFLHIGEEPSNKTQQNSLNQLITCVKAPITDKFQF